ncbi:SDR family NAD(P)-dependent oxidoreductase [Sneathiella glossodoripedis]|uniref:SDR family NAD(P)-dependent oxidoreductase n=1 Tax=Sneathiella glossodoripedis TaxID=418853 RepID=UPI000ADE1116|nr:SDR family oxidoreductase [Sneathiella glossodoripedis]
MTIALVTGVSGGIGAAIAKQLAQDGLEVVVTDRPGSAFSSAKAALQMPGYPADLGSKTEVQALCDEISQQYGPVQVLVNAAGGVCQQVHQPLETVTEEDWRVLFSANTDSAFFLAQAFAPQMKKLGSGRIVTISSGAGLRPSLTGIQAYTASKHALVGLTKQLALELGPFGITVNSIAPGFVLSNEATRKQWESYGEAGQKQLVENIHMRRLGSPEDIANAASFLCSEASDWISGQILCVDGGHR